MKANESNTDRIIRVIAGVLLVYLGTSTTLVSGALAYTIDALGVLLLVTGFIGFCPFYYLLKIKTN